MKKIGLIVFLAIVLSSCNMPTTPLVGTSTPDLVATQVSSLLTQMPTATLPAQEPSATPQPTDTQVPTQAISTPTETAVPPTPTTPPASEIDPPDWKDNLDGDKSFYKYENDNTRVSQENGRLVLTGITPNGWLGWSLTFSRKPSDFRLEAVFIPQTCSGADIYGLVFRAPNTNAGYFFGVTCDGRYNLHLRDFENDTDTVLVNLTNGTGIQPGANAVNRLAVKAVGEQISLYVNDTFLQEVSDSTYASGNFGAFVAANETPNFTVWMDEISLWDLP